jgi:hypothetical protein
LAGPEDVDDQPVLAPMDDDDLERSEDMADSIEDGWEPPPAIVTWSGGQLVVEDGNHRIEALRRAGASVCWCVVSSEDDAELARLAAELGAEVVPDRLGGGAPVR